MEKRLGRNREVREVFEEPDIVGEIRDERLRWAGHILRKNAEQIPKLVYDESLPGGRLFMRRPRTRWKD